MFEQIPRPLLLLSTTARIEILGRKVEKDNLMALDWFMPLSKEPAMCAIAVKTTRFSYRLIKESGVFALNLMPASKRKEAAYCGENSGEFMDKFEKTGLARKEAESIHCCIVGEAITVLECEVVKESETGDHMLFLAKISKVTQAQGKKNPLVHYKKGYSKVEDPE